MLEVLKKLTMAGTKTASAADLREALTGIDLEALGAAVKAAEAHRKEALLTASDRAVDAAEARLAQARRDLDRAHAASEELEMRIAHAEVAEARTALDAERAEADIEAEAAATELAKVYPGAAREIVRVLDRLEASERQVALVNQKLVDVGRATEERDDRIKRVEDRAFGRRVEYSSVRRLTSLRPAFGAPGYGQALHYMRYQDTEGE